MNFLFWSPQYYDGIVATVSQGLQKLGHYCAGLEQEQRNYLQPYKPDLDYDFLVYAPLENLDCAPVSMRKILLWVHDTVLPTSIHRFEPDKFKFDIAFVREMDEEHSSHPRVFPINFGSEDRYYQFTNKSIRGLGLRPIDIFFSGGYDPNGSYPHMRKRSEFLDKVINDFGDGYNIEIGNDKNKEPNSDYDYVANGRYRHFNDYFKCLSQTKIGLSIFGAGEDCMRLWEVAAAGAVPAIQRYTIRHVEPWWKDGVNCIEFDTYDEFKEKVEYYLDKDKGYTRLHFMQMRAWASGRRFHRTQHRAQYMLSKMQEVGLL